MIDNSTHPLSHSSAPVPNGKQIDIRFGVPDAALHVSEDPLGDLGIPTFQVASALSSAAF